MEFGCPAFISSSEIASEGGEGSLRPSVDDCTGSESVVFGKVKDVWKKSERRKRDVSCKSADDDFDSAALESRVWLPAEETEFRVCKLSGKNAAIDCKEWLPRDVVCIVSGRNAAIDCREWLLREDVVGTCEDVSGKNAAIDGKEAAIDCSEWLACAEVPRWSDAAPRSKLEFEFINLSTDCGYVPTGASSVSSGSSIISSTSSVTGPKSNSS